MFAESEQRELEKKKNRIIFSVPSSFSALTQLIALQPQKTWVWDHTFTGVVSPHLISLCCRHTGATAHRRCRKGGKSDFSDEELPLLLWQLSPPANPSVHTGSCTQRLISWLEVKAAKTSPRATNCTTVIYLKG